jgi:tetratricopeptide (TPR) repeat protein
MPRRIRDLLADRLRDLDEEQRSTLEAAAVDGVAFDGEAVAAVLDRPLLTVLRALQILYRERTLVVPERYGYRFAHPVFQEALYDELAPALRRALHRLLAEHLEGRPGQVDPERLGTHWELAGHPERARPYLLEAAVAAERRQEVARTISLCERAGLHADRMDPGMASRDVDACSSLATCLSDAGRYDQADRIYTALLDAARASGNDVLLYRTIVRRMRMLYPIKGVDVVPESDLRRATEVLPPSRELALAYYNLGLQARYRGDGCNAEREFREAARISAEIRNEAGRSSALDQLGTLAKMAGRWDDAERLYREAAEASASVGRRANAAISLVNRAILLFERGRLEEVEHELEEGARILDVEGSHNSALHASVFVAEVRLAKGDMEGARGRIEAVRKELEAAGFLPALCGALLLEAELALLRGDLVQFRGLLDRARVTATRCRKAESLARADALEIQACSFEGRAAPSSVLRELLARLGAREHAAERSGLAIRLAEAAMHGPDPETLVEMLREPDLLGAEARGAAAGALAARLPDGPVEEILAGARALEGEAVSERRAVLRIVARWLRACALDREGRTGRAIEEARGACEAARGLGHVWHEAALLAILERWSGERSYGERRLRLMASIVR